MPATNTRTLRAAVPVRAAVDLPRHARAPGLAGPRPSRSRSVTCMSACVRATPRSTRACGASSARTPSSGLDAAARTTPSGSPSRCSTAAAPASTCCTAAAGSTLRTRDPHRLVAGLVPPPRQSRSRLRRGPARGERRGARRRRPGAHRAGALRSWMSRVERRLNLRGLRVVDLPWVLLDPERHRRSSFPTSGLDVDWAALERRLDGDRAGIAPGSAGADRSVPADRLGVPRRRRRDDSRPSRRARDPLHGCTPTACSRRSTRWRR